jgi:hypothetical protein
MIEINLLRPQPSHLSSGEKILLDAMLMNAYRQGIAQAERNMAVKVIKQINKTEHRVAERRTADRRNGGNKS